MKHIILKTFQGFLKIIAFFITGCFLGNLLFLCFLFPKNEMIKSFPETPQKFIVKAKVKNKCETVVVKQYVGLSTVDKNGVRIFNECH